MKKNKKKIFYALSCILIIIGLYACSNSNETFENNQLKQSIKSNVSSKISNIVDSLSINIEEENYKIILSGNIVQNNINSTLKVYEFNNLLFEIPYDLDLSETHWKLKQASKIILKAEDLKHINAQKIIDVKNIFDKSIDYIFVETLDVKNTNLLSIINYYNSVINTRIRATKENSDCNCSVHPAFLVDKSFFNCQEDQTFNVKKLSNILENYSTNNELDSSTSQLISFLNNTNSVEIRFDEYYNFYFPKEEFNNSISDFLTNSSKKRCWLGLGSGHGCCGNYSGCCYYVNPICHVHDAMCSDCKPSWFCLPGCKPDKIAMPVKSITII